MTTSARIRLREKLSENLTVRWTARNLFEEIELLPERKVLLDFSDVNSISRAFAHEYLKRKTKSSKTISETNLPKNVQKMFELVSNSKEKPKIVSKKIEVVNL